MNREDLWQAWSTLPPIAQQELLDFMTFLHQKYQELPLAEISPKQEPFDWEAEAFVGMWADREDMQDSTGWVRQLREKEWE